MNALTTLEAARLAELEPIIERGMASFVEVGNALAEINSRRLYRATHSTFKAYVEETWKISVRTAYERIECAELVKTLPEKCADSAQISYSQARALAKLPRQDRAAALELAAENGKVTAEAIREVAAPPTVKRPKKARVIEVDSNVEVQQAAEELDVAMEDIKVVLGKLEDGEVFGAEPEMLNACADELAKVARMLRKMAKGAK